MSIALCGKVAETKVLISHEDDDLARGRGSNQIKNTTSTEKKAFYCCPVASLFTFKLFSKRYRVGVGSTGTGVRDQLFCRVLAWVPRGYLPKCYAVTGIGRS